MKWCAYAACALFRTNIPDHARFVVTIQSSFVQERNANINTMSGMKRYEGKVCVVTASTAGIGLAIAARFALEGGKVVISSRKQAGVDKALQAIRSQNATIVAMVRPAPSASPLQRSCLCVLLARTNVNCHSDFPRVSSENLSSEGIRCCRLDLQSCTWDGDKASDQERKEP
jgi:hypothetical protein